MTTIVSELYEALKSVGVEDDKARAAAKAVVAIEDKEQLATKADLMELKLATRADLVELRSELRLEMAELKDSLIRWTVGTVIGMTGLFAAIVRFLR